MSTRSVHMSLDEKFEVFDNGFQQLVHGKYKLRILWHLQCGPRRFGEIKKGLNTGTLGTKGVAPRVLSRELKVLAGIGLVRRRAYNVVPPRVEYSLTPLGRTLLPIISRLRDWGIRHALPQPAKRTYQSVSQMTEPFSGSARARWG